MNKELLNDTLLYFKFATEGEYPLLEFKIENNWLTVNHRETLTADGNEWKWSILCSQCLEDYAVCSGVQGKKVIERIKTEKLVNRITLMLAEKLRSAKQDINIIYQDYNLIRK